MDALVREANELFDEIEKLEDQGQDTVRGIAVHRAGIDEKQAGIDHHKDEISKLASADDQHQAHKRDRVIRLGKVLIKHKAEFGKGWKGAWDYHGFEFSYPQARFYIQCSRSPKSYRPNIKDWARAAEALEQKVCPGQTKHPTAPTAMTRKTASQTPATRSGSPIWRPPKRGKLGKQTWFQVWVDKLGGRGRCDFATFWKGLSPKDRDRFYEILWENPQYEIIPWDDGTWEFRKTLIVMTGDLEQDFLKALDQLYHHMDGRNDAHGNWSLVWATLRAMHGMLAGSK